MVTYTALQYEILFVLGFTLFTTIKDLVKWIRHIDVEICEMNEEHKNDNSSNVPQDDLYLIAQRIHWIATCADASGWLSSSKSHCLK